MAETTPEMLAMANWYGPASSITKADAVYLADALEHYKVARGEGGCILGNAIVRRLKKLPGWRSPYKFFSSTNCKGSWVIASYHHRAQLCWEWSLWFSIGRQARRSWRPWRWVSWGCGWYSFGIPWLFELALTKQKYGHMLSIDGENLIRFAAEAHGIEGRAPSIGEHLK